MRGTAVATRLGPEELARLDEVVRQRGTSRSEALRALTRRELDPPERIELEEALDLLDAKARAGNVQAIIKIVDRLLSERRVGRPDLRAEFGLRAVD